jgi:hypothetical protein
MRKIEIGEEANSQRRWTAIDKKTGEVVLRLHDQDQLRNVCRSLGWEIAEAQGQKRTA